MAVHSFEAFDAIRKLIKFPDYCTRAVITLDVDFTAEVECTYWPDINHMGLVTKKYRLVEVPSIAKLSLSPDVVVSDSFRAEFDAWLLDMFAVVEPA